MEVDYGTISLRVLDFSMYSRQAVYTQDEADLLYVKHSLGFSGVYAPGGTPGLDSVAALSPETAARLNRTDSTSRILGVSPGGVDPGTAPAPGIFDPPVMEPRAGGMPVGTPAFGQRTGPETDAELYLRLMTPRQRLVVWAFDRQTGGRIAWLESPRPGFSVDAANGPKPVACDIISVAGEPHSVGVYYQIETYQPPCPVGSDRLILSHRWEVSHGHDDDYYLTRVITGTVVFHAGVRDLIGIHPDRIRNQFLHPIPLGFRRGLPEITQSSDGLTIHYVITDTDPTIIFAPGDSGATQIDIKEKFQYTTPPLSLPGALTRDWYDPRGWIGR